MKKILYIFLFISSIGYSQDCTLYCDSLTVCGFITQADLPINNDNDSSNELQQISINGNVITLSNGGGSITLPTATDNQLLTYDPNLKRLSIEDGNFVNLGAVPTWTTLVAPAILGGGTATVTLDQVLEIDTKWIDRQFGTCREQYRFHKRVLIDQTAGNGWGYLTIPNIAGWDTDVRDVTTYRFNGNSSEDNGTRGALGTAPIMNQEAMRWSNSIRIYIAQANFRDNASRIYIEFDLIYERN